MANNKGKVTFEKSIEKKVFDIGPKYAKSLEPALKANKEWLASMEALKKSALGYAKLEKQFKAAKGRKEFLAALKEEEVVRKNAVNAVKDEEKARVDAERVKQAELVTAKRRLELSKKEIELADKVATQKKKNTKLTVEEKLANQQVNKTKREDAVLTSKLTGAYQKLNLKRTQAKTTLQNLIASEEASTKEIEKAQKAFNKLDAKVNKADLAVRDFGKNVGNYPRQLGRGIASIKNLMGAFGAVGGIMLFAKIMKESFAITRDFEKQMATTAGVLGKTRKEIKPLTDDAKRLGATTEFTAKQVGTLQEAYARLGFTQEQILDTTEATLKGATALQSDLGETADLVGSTLNQFGLDAKESGRIVDVLSKSTQISALNFKKLQTALPIVGKVAKLAGVSFEETASMLGVLSSNGIDASTSASALRNIFLDLAANGLTLEEALGQINNSTDKLNTANELFGKRGATVAVTLAENTDLAAKFSDQLNNAGGSAEKLAKEQLDTLDGSIKLLSSAWEGFILSVDNGSGVFGSITRGIIDFGTAILTAFTPSIDKATELSNSFFKQQKSVESLDKSISPLLTRYDELTKKTKGNTTETKLSKKEQIELDGIILKVAEDIPSAVTAFDEYGKALGINTTAAKNFIKQQKQILAIKNAEAIEEQVKAIKGLNTEITTTTNTLNGVSGGYREVVKQNGKFYKQVIKGGKVTRTELEEIEGGVERFAGKLEELQNEKLGREGILAQLRGNKTKEQIAAEAEEAILNAKNLAGATDDLVDSESKLNAERRKALAEANHTLKIAQLQEEIDKYKEVAEDEENLYSLRYRALVSLNESKKQLIEEQYKYDAENIDKTIKDEEIAKAKKKVLEINYNSDINKIKGENTQLAEKLLKDNFEAVKRNLEGKKKAQNEALAAEIESLQGQLQRKEISVEQYEEKVLELKKKKAREGLEVAISTLETEINTRLLAGEDVAALEEQLSATRRELSNNDTEVIIEDLEKQKEAEEKLAAAKAKIIKDGSKGLAEALGIDAAHLEDFITGVVSGFGEEIDPTMTEFQQSMQKTHNAFAALGSVASVVGDIVSAVFEGNIQNLENELDANEEYYARKQELAGDDQRKKDLLKKEEQRKSDILKRKIAKEKTKAAKAEKAAALVQAGINTALAITSALTMAPPAAYVMAALSAAMGIAQIAAIASKPIPKYAKGTDYHPGGHALVGEERAEVISEPGKAPYIVDGPQVLDLAEGTKVTPSLGEYEKLMRASIMASLDIDNQKAKKYNSEATTFDQNLLLMEMKLTREAIERQQTNINIEGPKIDLEYLAHRNEQLNG